MTDPNTITRTEYIDSNSNDTDEQVISYNADDNKIQESFYNDADGTLISKVNYSYNNESGALQKVITTNADGDEIRTEEDTNGDGTLETVYTYDDDGNTLSRTIDFEGDGEIDLVKTYTYNESGQKLTVSSDYGDDGTQDVIRTVEYDENNDITIKKRDYDGDGKAEFIKTIERTEETIWEDSSSKTDASSLARQALVNDDPVDIGSIVTVKTSYNYDGEGGPEVSSTRTYNNDTDIRTTAYDYDGDGNIDHMIEEGGEEGGKYENLYIETYYDAAADVTRSTTVETDDNRRRITFDYDGDSHTPNRVIEAYRQSREYGEAVTVQYDHDGNGNVDRTETAIYSRSYNLDSEMDARLVESKGKGGKGKDGKGKGGKGKGGKDNHRKGEDSAYYGEGYDSEGMYGPGNPEIVMYDHDLHDDTLDRVVEYEYDEAGNVIKEFHYFYEATADGDSSEIVFQPNNTANQVFTYDAKGNLLSETYDNNDDSEIDEARTYDAEGNLLSEATFSNGVAPNGETVLRPDGSLESQSYDRDEDGNVDQLYQYDENENLYVMQADTDGDGVLDHTRFYDESENLIYETLDTDGDGEVDVELDYDADGNLVYEAYDVDADGVLDEYTTYEYVESKDRLDKTEAVDELTGQRRVLSNAHDDSGDGIADHFLNYEYHENGEVRQQVEAHDYDNDGWMDETYTSTYDKAGNIIVYTEDKTGDGQANYIETYTYDANGNNLTYVEDKNGDGKAEYTEAYTYDANNEYLTEAYDHNGDGIVDEYYNYSGILKPTDDSELLKVKSLGNTSALTLDVLNINVDNFSDILVFTVDGSSGERTQVGSFSILGDSGIGSAFSLATTLQGEYLGEGQTIQFEMVQNGESVIATVKSSDNDTAIVDFGNGTQLKAFLENIDENSTNLLVDDAAALDLTNYGQATDVSFTIYREANYNNTVGFYTMQDNMGGVLDGFGNTLMPGDKGYKEAALANRLDVSITGQNNKVTRLEAQIDGGYVGTFLISDGSDASGDVYFGHAAANLGQNDHVKQLGNNIFGFEDMAGLGDRDFNDIVVGIQIAPTATLT